MGRELVESSTILTYHHDWIGNYVWMTILCCYLTFQGYLYKKSHGLNKDWKKKYVTLLDDGRLTYHPSLHVSLLRNNKYKLVRKIYKNDKVLYLVLSEACFLTKYTLIQ